MNVRPSVLCPVDFSDGSRGALRYAAAIAAHFGTRLLVLTVEDPLLTEAMDLGAGIVWKPEDSQKELAQFAAKTFGREHLAGATLEFEVAVGKPAAEILRVARERSCDLIVISSHGLTGLRKLFFGSTTERVLRETTRPVLITPAGDPGPADLEDVTKRLRRILVPVDLSPASSGQIKIAQALSMSLATPLIVAHALEPVRSRLVARLHLTGLDADRKAVAEDELEAIVADTPQGIEAETLVAYGDPAEEIAKIANDRRVGLIVMGLHASPALGPRMGSVTYRILCLTTALVLALPPGLLQSHGRVAA